MTAQEKRKNTQSLDRIIRAPKPKQMRYKTAFHNDAGVYVTLTDAHQNENGDWIYTCWNTDQHILSEVVNGCRLSRFCL